MKIFLAFCCNIAFIISCFSQSTDGFFILYKKDGSPVKNIKQSAYFMYVLPQNDTTYICRYYNTNGPMMRQESFKDSNLTIPNGRFCWYNSKGILDSTGYVTNGKKDGSWEYKRSAAQTDFYTYQKGVLEKKETILYDKNGKPLRSDTTKEDTIRHTQITAKYKNGIDDWTSYCQQNLSTPVRLQNVLPPGVHTVTVCFLVNKQGNTADIFLIQSCEWSGDAEVLRLIADSPKWQPAIQDGKPVIYRQKQSLSYNVKSY